MESLPLSLSLSLNLSLSLSLFDFFWIIHENYMMPNKKTHC